MIKRLYACHLPLRAGEVESLCNLNDRTDLSFIGLTTAVTRKRRTYIHARTMQLPVNSWTCASVFSRPY